MTFKPLDELRALRDLRDISSTGKIVLMALILRADEQGLCWPSFETLGADAGMDPRSVKRVIKKLAAAGHVSAMPRRADGRTTSNLYRVHLVHTGVTHDPTGVTHDHSVLSDTPSPPGVTHDHPRGDPRSQDLPNELPIGTAHGREALVLAHSAPSLSPKKARKAKTSVPGSDACSEDLAAWCIRWEIPSPSESGEVAKMLDHFRANAKPMGDWAAVWRNWQRRAPEFASKAGARIVQPGPPDGVTPGWKLRQEARRRAEGEQ
jgi:hypothetical protein